MGSAGRPPGHPEISQTGTDGIGKHRRQYRVPESKRRWVSPDGSESFTSAPNLRGVCMCAAILPSWTGRYDLFRRHRDFMPPPHTRTPNFLANFPHFFRPLPTISPRPEQYTVYRYVCAHLVSDLSLTLESSRTVFIFINMLLTFAGLFNSPIKYRSNTYIVTNRVRAPFRFWLH